MLISSHTQARTHTHSHTHTHTHTAQGCHRTIKFLKYNNNNKLFMAPHLVRAQNIYKDIRICSFHHTHTLTHPHTSQGCHRMIKFLKYNHNNRLFMARSAPHLIRAWSSYKDIWICSFHHTHTLTHTPRRVATG